MLFYKSFQTNSIEQNESTMPTAENYRAKMFDQEFNIEQTVTAAFIYRDVGAKVAGPLSHCTGQNPTCQNPTGQNSTRSISHWSKPH